MSAGSFSPQVAGDIPADVSLPGASLFTGQCRAIPWDAVAATW
jgi:hypothetical protein